MEVYYKPNDIVWVKLGPFWWPGEVVEKSTVPKDLIELLKKEPIAIVRFFDDDGFYEFVKTSEAIFPYNCDRKFDFIKKGMDAYRAKNPKMASFPKDVSAAEVKTGGNANILSDPYFTKERKRNYVAEIFGSPSAKKPRESIKGRTTQSEPLITHRRFLGYDDYEARVLIPSAEDANQDDEIPVIVPRTETFNKFTCPSCHFSSDRLGILMKHTSCHIKEISFQSRNPIKKIQKKKRKRVLSDNDVSSDGKKTKAKRKSTVKKVEVEDASSESSEDFAITLLSVPSTPSVLKDTKQTVEQKKDICNDIIADWDDESNHEDSLVDDTLLVSTLSEIEPSEIIANTSLLDSSTFQPLGEDLQSTKIDEDTSEKKNKSSEESITDKSLITEKNPNKSCFDFDEDEEETRIPDATSGRKIPRVIPISERRKTYELEDEIIDDEEEKKKKEILQESEALSKLTESSQDEDKESENLEKTYQSLMESTENLEIPDVPNILKNEQNFHSAKTVKYPDKDVEESSDLIEPEVVEDKISASEKLEMVKGTQMAECSSKKVNEQKSAEDSVQLLDERIDSKFEIKESDLDALMAKHQMEPENLEKELDIESDVSPNVSFIVNDVVVTDDILHNERQLQEDIDKSAENENKDVNKEKETITEIPLSKQENPMKEIVISQEVEMGETIPIEKSSSLIISEQVELQSEKSSETKVDDVKFTSEISSDNEEDQKLEPEPKRRKTDENKSRFAKTKENSSRKNRRGRSGDAEKAKLIEDASSSLLEKNVKKELKKPGSSRSTIQLKSATKVDNTTLPSLTLPIQETLEEENKVIIETRELNQNSEIDNEKKISESVEADITEEVKSLSNEENEVSALVPTSQINEETTSNEKLRMQTKPGKKEIPDETEDKSSKLERNEKSHRSRRSPVKEKRLSDSDKTHKKESESKDDSTHRSSKSRRTSSRHEKRKFDSSEGEKSDLHDDLQTKHFKESETPKKSNNSKDPSDREIRRSSDRERNTRRSSRKDSKMVDEHPQKSRKSPVIELVEDQKAHNSSSRDSKRQSRSSKSSRDSFTSLDGKKLKSPDSKELKTLTSGESKNSVRREAKTPPSKESKSPVGKEPKTPSSKEPKTPSSKEPKTPLNKERKTSSNKESSTIKEPKTPTSKQSKASISKETKTPSKESETLTTKEQKTPREESKTREEQKTPTKCRDPISPCEKTKDTISPSKKEHVELESRLRKSGKSLGKDEIDPIRELFAPSGHVSKTKEQKREELKNIFSFDYDEKDLKKRKTYSHRRKSKPISPEKIQLEGSQATVVSLPPDEETPEVQKEVLLKSEEISIPIEEAKPEETKENVQQVSEEISLENEVIIDVGTEETVIESKQKQNACTSEAQMDEIIDKQSTESDNKIEVTPASEIVSNKVTDSLQNKIDEESVQTNIEIEITDHKQPVNHNVLRENEAVVSKDVAEKKEEFSKVAKPRKPRKPSRWDQVEKTTVCTAEETIKSHNNEEINKEENKVEITNVEIPEDISIIASTSQVSLDVDESSQTEIAEILSKKKPFNLEDKNADQIELIFGSSPLPGSSENNIFGGETEKLAEIDQSQSLGVIKDEKAKEEFPHDGNSSKDLSFELVSDMDSLESQVARITHYEEPAIEQKNPNEVELVVKEKVESILNNPEKCVNPVLESMQEKVDALVESLPEQSSSKPEETVPLEAESTISVLSNTEEAHLFTEENEKPVNIPCEPSTNLPDAAPKPSDKPNEVATKLTNPKKRFVKCFQASELDKRKREKSLEAEQAASTAKETKPQTSPITGKPPIAFKLKKQLLSKSSSIFDEDDDKKETKALPKLKPLKKDLSFLCKKKESVSVAKNENLPTLRCEITDKTEKKTENTQKTDVVEKIFTSVEELNKEPLNMPIVKNLLSGLTPVSDEKKEELCQKEVVDVTPIKNLESENSSSLVLFSSESNSIDFCIDSTKSMLANIEEFKELQPTLNEQVHNIVAGPLDKPNDQIDISKTEIITKNFPIDENKKEETEYVSIDGNLTVVSEKELAEGQVEITANMSSKKPMTLSSFSMDFSDDSNDAISESIRNKKIQDIADSLVAKVVEKETIVAKTDFEQKAAVDVKDSSEVTKNENEKLDHDILNEKLIEDNKEHVVEICTIEGPTNNIEIESISFEEKQPTIDVVHKEQVVVDETSSEIEANVTKEVLIDETSQIAANVTKQVPVDETISQIASNVIEQVLVDVTTQIASNDTKQVLVDETSQIASNFTKQVVVDQTTSQIASNVTNPVELVDSLSSAGKNQTEAVAIELAVHKTDNSNAISPSEDDSKVKKTDSESLSIVNEIETLPKTAKQSEIKSLTKPAESVPTRSRVRESAKSNEKNVVNEPLVIYNTAKSSTVTDMCDLEDHIPSQIVFTKKNEEVMKVAAGINNDLSKEKLVKEPEMSKLLIKYSDKKEDAISKIRGSEAEAKTRELEKICTKSELNSPKNLPKPIIKSKIVNPVANAGVKSSNKAIILSEKIIRPAREVAVPAQKRPIEDVEDIEPYVIAKTPKLEPITQQKISATPKNSKQFVINANRQVPGLKKTTGKAKILNQTIIRPASDAVQMNKIPVGEDNVEFDINSMPIVLSDELLTPESLESMPIVLGEQAQKANPTNESPKILIEKKAQLANKSLTKPISMPTQAATPPTVRMPLKKTTPKILQTARPTQKIVRQMTPVSSKAGKFVVVPEHPNRPQQIVKKQPNLLRKALTPTCAASTTQSTSSETTGHKIMIFTNQQGKQQRLLLTPAQQKLIGMQLPGKTVMKSSAVTQKSQLVKVQTGTQASTSKLPGQALQTPKFKMNVGTPTLSSPQLKIVPPRKSQKVPGLTPSKSQQKTILISNQHGQMVKKIQGTNEALLDKQVAEQLEAIKNSSMKAHQKQQEATSKAPIPKSHTVTSRKPSIKRPESKQPMAAQTKPASTPTRIVEPKIPPLSPLQHESHPEELQKQSQSKSVQKNPDRPLHQLVIQDNMGNQTTITEGQILALPSETVDGQPQSYMLVTLDETGNLTPLNNEALMSLDPSLAGLAGGDLSNMVLQMDAGTSKDNVSHTAKLHAAPPSAIIQEKPRQEVQQQMMPSKTTPAVESAQVQVTCNINGEQGQQIILTGDPVATQKFLDSLTDGSTDLSNILAGAEGNSILIQADGQQILINTESTDTAGMLEHNTATVDPHDQGNPMFSTHPGKNQDILAAALADTDVFQSEQVTSQGKITHSQLSPSQSLFPMNVGNVVETCLTLNSPIMTPLEVPSTNSKRIPDEEADILTTHVPKNVDLPITITDPNISQTVSHQQVLMASDLQSNLELTLPISETSMSVGMHSPSFVYSLPSLDVSEHAEISQKTFSGSMPLLTEDIEMKSTTVIACKENSIGRGHMRKIGSGGTFMEEGLCNLGAEMCSSLSEPPPEMFDIPIENDYLNNKSLNTTQEKSNIPSVESGLLTDDSSLEISVQSQIVSDFKDSSQSSDSSSSVSQDKKL